jgi:hypothetical protein
VGGRDEEREVEMIGVCMHVVCGVWEGGGALEEKVEKKRCLSMCHCGVILEIMSI